MTAFQVGSLPVYVYGGLVALAALAALLLMIYTGKKQGLSEGTVSWFAVLAVPLVFLMARAGYCLANIKWVMERGLGFFFRFTSGGYLLYGGIIGGILAAWLTAKIAKQPFKRVLDAAAAPAALLIAAGRLAETTIGLGYGYCIEDWFDPWMEISMIPWENYDLLYRFPFAVQDYYETWNFAIFLPEALTALVMLVLLLAMKKRRDGGAALLLLLVYACCQIVFESMRQDQVIVWGFIRANQMFSALMIVGVLLISWQMTKKEERKNNRLWLAFIQILLCAGVVIVMEFALEQKIAFLAWMRMDVCYFVMALACTGLLLTVLPFWRRAFPIISGKQPEQG